jgi:pyruvate, water dikinase
LNNATVSTSKDCLTETRFIRPFRTIANRDVLLVGGKNASLGEMYRELTPLGIRIPNGFAVTAEAYRQVLENAGAVPVLHALLDGFGIDDVEELAARSRKARELVLKALLPTELTTGILSAYRELQAQYGTELSVAVRSSATAEDLPDASFAGQHESFLNVRGEDAVIDAYRRCLASLFLERAIHYRIDKGFDHFKVALSVGIMKMVRSDLASSGVAFTIDTETGFRDVVFITGSYGLGEYVVGGTVDPDEFYVHKPTFEQGYRCVLRRRIGSKERRLVFGATAESAATCDQGVPGEQRLRACVDDTDVLEIADACIEVERHYSSLAGHALPMDVEWAKDGTDGRIYLVQARPETAVSRRKTSAIEAYTIETTEKPLILGRAVGTAVAAGPVRIVRSADELALFRAGEVLVAGTTTPDWEPVMKIASAIVTDRGGRTCHAAIVARELGIPAVVGAETATKVLSPGSDVTVSCAQGDEGRVYGGRVPFKRSSIDAASLPVPPVDVMLILGDPESAFARSMLPNAGVGLVRIEFIVSDEIGIHPMALAHPDLVTDPHVRASVAARTLGYSTPSEYFVAKLAEGVGTIAAAFYPKPVVVRMSDFKSNEYARLLGGTYFEPHEENPMLGLRGASRYTHPSYADGFALECAAMKRVRDQMGLCNVILMIPFCRRIGEAQRTIARMAELGLRRGENGLQIYVMCEIPNNVIQIDAFSQYFDGFSIGSNDLTQLTLGIDRDSALVASEFDERDAGVMELLRQAVTGAKRNGRYVGICGQAPSDYAEIARLLMRLGIDSISVNPDSVVRTIEALT